MSQIRRPTFSPVFCVQGRMRNVERSGRRYMSDSSIRTNPSIDEPSNMIWPSSAVGNCRSGISTFLITPRMSVNCSRMNLTFARSAISRIFARFSAAAGSANTTLCVSDTGLLLGALGAYDLDADAEDVGEGDADEEDDDAGDVPEGDVPEGD